MYTLQNPRHESFALALAQGATPEGAYQTAGFSDNNRKARAHELAQDPEILERVAFLSDCLPEIDALRDRFAPSLLLMPETKEQMIAWLWQVMNGTRKILPLQLRAANLFCRLNGWHLPNPAASVSQKNQTAQQQQQQPPKPKKPLLDSQRHILAFLSRRTVQDDLALTTLSAKEAEPFYSKMADIDIAQAVTTINRRAAKQAAAQSSPVAPQLVPSPVPETTANSASGAQPSAPCTLPPAAPAASDSSSLIPHLSSQPAAPAVAPAKSPNGDKNDAPSPSAFPSSGSLHPAPCSLPSSRHLLTAAAFSDASAIRKCL